MRPTLRSSTTTALLNQGSAGQSRAEQSRAEQGVRARRVVYVIDEQHTPLPTRDKYDSEKSQKEDTEYVLHLLPTDPTEL